VSFRWSCEIHKKVQAFLASLGENAFLDGLGAISNWAPEIEKIDTVGSQQCNSTGTWDMCRFASNPGVRTAPQLRRKRVAGNGADHARGAKGRI